MAQSKAAWSAPVCPPEMIFGVFFRNSYSLMLVSTDQFGPREYMALHCFFERGLGWFPQVRDNRIERIKLVKIAMSANRRTGAAVTGALPVIQALQRACWKLFHRNRLMQ